MSPATVAALTRTAHRTDGALALAGDVDVDAPVPFEITARAEQLLEERFGPERLLEADRFRCLGAYSRRWTS